MTTVGWIIFTTGTIFIILFSWFVSIREKRYHGIPRFFAFEALLLLGLLQGPSWFKDPFTIHQIISWLLFLVSIYCIAASVFLYHHHAEHGKNFENSTRLVTRGIYRYVRHPMYGSLLFLGWGMCFKAIHPTAIFLACFITLLLFLTCKVEEKEMVQKFGEEYRQYMKTTKMWIPYII